GKSRALFACRACQDGSHQLGRGLMRGCSLALEFPKDARRKRDIRNDRRSRGQRGGRNLLFQNAGELAHPAPSLGGVEPWRVGHDTNISSTEMQNVRLLSN